MDIDGSPPRFPCLRGMSGCLLRAQLARLYAKSGVANRTQFVCLFIDDLLEQPIVTGNAQPEGRPSR